MSSLCIKNLFRITYRLDPVVHLPFKEMGFAHLYPEVFCVKAKCVICERESVKNCSESLDEMTKELDDHKQNFGVHLSDGK